MAIKLTLKRWRSFLCTQRQYFWHQYHKSVQDAIPIYFNVYLTHRSFSNRAILRWNQSENNSRRILTGGPQGPTTVPTTKSLLIEGVNSLITVQISDYPLQLVVSNWWGRGHFGCEDTLHLRINITQIRIIFVYIGFFFYLNIIFDLMFSLYLLRLPQHPRVLMIYLCLQNM